MEANILKEDKTGVFKMTCENDADILSEAYQSELRVIIPNHQINGRMDEIFEDYCSSYGHSEICK